MLGVKSCRIAQEKPTEALQAKLGTLSLEAQEKLEKDTAKKEAKAEAKAEAAQKKKMVRILVSIGRSSLTFCDLVGITSNHQANRAEQTQVRNGCTWARGLRCVHHPTASQFRPYTAFLYGRSPRSQTSTSRKLPNSSHRSSQRAPQSRRTRRVTTKSWCRAMSLATSLK